MNTADILSLISIICYILAGVSLVLVVFFWFFFKIPTVIGDLSGRTAKKTIAKMRRANEYSGNKSFRSSAVNVQRGKLTDVMPQEKKKAAKEDSRPETGLLEENKAQAADNQQTELLGSTKPTADPNETMPLNSSETELLKVPVSAAPVPAAPVFPAAPAVQEGSEETVPLNSSETELLETSAPAAPIEPLPVINSGSKNMRLLEQVVLIHTDEYI